MEVFDQLSLDQTANDRKELALALDGIGLFDMQAIDAVGLLEPASVVFGSVGGRLICSIDLFFVGTDEIRNSGLAQEEQILHDILVGRPERCLDHVENLAGTEEVVGVVDICFVESLPIIVNVEEEEAMLNQYSEAMAKLTLIQIRIVLELWDGASASERECGKYSRGQLAIKLVN